MATKLFQLLPWVGGLNTNLDASIVPQTQLVRANNVQTDSNGVKKKRDGIKHNLDTISIASVSVANPSVITTSTAHGLTTGDSVVIAGTSTSATIIGTRVVTVTGVTTFTIPVNVASVTTGTGTLYYTTSTDSLLGLHDFWFGTTSKTQRQVSVASDRTYRSYNAGTITAIADAGTAWTGTLTSVCMTTFNNLCIIAASGTGNVLKKWSGSGNIGDLDGTPPVGSIVGTHIGRLLSNDKTNLDRLHYSPTSDHTQWNGAGDSGAIDIGIGDGDPDGITAFISWKGDLFVFKRTKTYRVSGTSPETLTVELISSGVGCISQNSIAMIDQDDIYFVSERGVHSLSATANFGDVENTFVSIDIQKTFRDDLNKSRIKFCFGRYLSEYNCYFLALPSSGATSNDSLYSYHIPSKSWYLWPSLPCQSMAVVRDSDKIRLYLGRTDARISKTFNGTNYDISVAGVNTAIPMEIKTGFIYPEQQPYVINGFKRVILYYTPKGSHTITVSAKIDNIVSDPISFTQSNSLDLLGTTFILGASILGQTYVMGPHSRMIDGVGRGIQLTIVQSGTDQQIELLGIGIEYETLGALAEVF